MLKIDDLVFKPIASESLGVRSMVAILEYRNVKIFLDPSSSLGYRFNLPPSKKEKRIQIKTLKSIIDLSQDVDFIFISHYHFDHYLPKEPTELNLIDEVDKNIREIVYRDKKIIAKNINDKINKNQRNRGLDLFINFKKEIVSLDNSKIRIDNFYIFTTPPLPHGVYGQLGYVIGLGIEENKEVLFLYLPDVFGIIEDRVLNYIKSLKPRVLVLGGYPIYFDFRYRKLNKSVNNLREISKFIDILVLDHHFFRDLKAIKLYSEIKKFYKTKGKKVYNYAEILGKEMNLLEAKRKEIIKNERSGGF